MKSLGGLTKKSQQGIIIMNKTSKKYLFLCSKAIFNDIFLPWRAILRKGTKGGGFIALHSLFLYTSWISEHILTFLRAMVLNELFLLYLLYINTASSPHHPSLTLKGSDSLFFYFLSEWGFTKEILECYFQLIACAVILQIAFFFKHMVQNPQSIIIQYIGCIQGQLNCSTNCTMTLRGKLQAQEK